MRILIVANGIPTEKYPLLGIFEFDQAKALANIGLDVTFFCIDLRSFRRGRKLGYQCGIKDKIKWYSFSLPVGAIPLSFFCKIGELALTYLYKKVYKNMLPPDIIHSHFTEMGCMSVRLSKKQGIPLVITEHSSAINGTHISSSLLKCAFKGYSQASIVISVSQRLADNIQKYTGIESCVIHNIIDVGLFSKCILREHEGFRIATTAGLISSKRIQKLLEAIKDLQSEYPDIYIDLVGDGPLRSKLEKYVYRNKLNDKVIFHGQLSREETSIVYEQADCFAMVSESETFGVVYVEAMAAGIPVIATRCGGPEDFVNEINGLLVEVDNLNEIKEAIVYMYNNRNKYNLDDIRGFANKYFSPSYIATRIKDVYLSLME